MSMVTIETLESGRVYKGGNILTPSMNDVEVMAIYSNIEGEVSACVASRIK
jgi:hypothetical protein